MDKLFSLSLFAAWYTYCLDANKKSNSRDIIFFSQLPNNISCLKPYFKEVISK